MSRLTKDLTLATSGDKIPKLIYGTAWKAERSASLVYTALKNGFRAVDTAAQPKHYYEKGVGDGVRQAIRDGIVRREDLFVRHKTPEPKPRVCKLVNHSAQIQTKFSPTTSQGDTAPYDLTASVPDQVRQSVESSLRNFAIDGHETYLDSILLHSPLQNPDDTLLAWKTLSDFVPGKVKNIGISNVTLETLMWLYDKVDIKPSVVQNRFHEQTAFEVDLRAFCLEKEIVFQSFWTLSANKTLYRSVPVKNVAEKAGVARAAAYYAMVLGLEGIAILDGTTNETHMAEDLEGMKVIEDWASTDGASDWNSSMAMFNQLIGQYN